MKMNLRSILRKYAPDLKGKEIEEILEKPKNGKVNYKAFVTFWRIIFVRILII